MAELKDKISKEIMQAMKNKEKVRLNAFRYVKKLLIENETSSKPQAELDVLIGYVKQLKKSIAEYPAGSEQAVEMEQEINALKDFLPKELTEEEVVAIINEIKSSLEKPNMGLIMKELSPRIKGQFDGKRASDLVKAALN